MKKQLLQILPSEVFLTVDTLMSLEQMLADYKEGKSEAVPPLLVALKKQQVPGKALLVEAEFLGVKYGNDNTPYFLRDFSNGGKLTPVEFILVAIKREVSGAGIAGGVYKVSPKEVVLYTEWFEKYPDLVAEHIAYWNGVATI